MNSEKLLETLHILGKLKDTTRHCYNPSGRHESVAEHSWRISLMAMLIRDEFPDADMDKVIRMCIIHDLGEVFTGDIPTFEKTANHEKNEEELLSAFVDTLPQPYRSEFSQLYAEMEERKTLEAKLYKALDSTEALISHNESDLSTWSENEFSLNLTYAFDKVEFSPYLTELRRAILRETEEKIKNK